MAPDVSKGYGILSSFFDDDNRREPLRATHTDLYLAMRQGVRSLKTALAEVPDVDYYLHLDELLWLASGDDHEDAIQYLLGAGAQIGHISGTPPMDALSVAISLSNEKALQLLLPRCEIMWSRPYLVLACIHLSPKWVRELLLYETNVDHIDQHFGTAIHAAVARLSLPITRALVKVGADVNLRWKQATPLQILLDKVDLSRPQDRELAELMLDLGAEADLSKVSGETSARFATMIGQRSAKRRRAARDPDSAEW